MQVVDGSVHDAGNKASVTIISEVFSNHSKLESCATGSCVRVHFQNGTYSCHEVTFESVNYEFISGVECFNTLVQHCTYSLRLHREPI